MARSNPVFPTRADHRFIRNILDTIYSGKVVHLPHEYDRLCAVFKKAGGSWERIFRGNVDDICLLKKIIKIAVRDKHLTPKGSWK